jgi:hypothetical protein
VQSRRPRSFSVARAGGQSRRRGRPHRHQLVAKSPADGYTLLLGSGGPPTINATFNKVN